MPEKTGLFERSRHTKFLHRELFAKLLDEWGINGKPIKAQELQAMMEAEGMRPENNELSSSIIKMREG